MPVAGVCSARTGRSQNGRVRRYRVVAHGLRYFCQKLPALLNDEHWEIVDRSRHTYGHLARLVTELPQSDLVFQWGGRIDMGPFLWGARSLGVRKLVTFWCGSDVLRAQKLLAKGVDPWIARQIHWAASPSLAEEVRALGLACHFVQASFVDEVPAPTSLPKEFLVLVFLPRADQAELYGWDRIAEVAQALPFIKFKLVGLHKGQKVQTPPNVTAHERTQDLNRDYDETTVMWRPVRHDAGMSFMVLEAMARGRHVLYSYPVVGSVLVRNAADAKAHLQRLYAMHQLGTLPLNHAGMRSVEQTYSSAVVRRNLRARWKELIEARGE